MPGSDTIALSHLTSLLLRRRVVAWDHQPVRTIASHFLARSDSTFLIDRFEAFLTKQVAANRPWLAHICFHAIHEPHPAMPQFYHLYQHDPDYLGALTMWDTQIGRLMQLLEDKGAAENTAIFYTADNGPHQGKERTDIHWSTNFLRQCKASMWEGGIRVPGLMHFPRMITENKNVSTPTTTADFLPTIMSILQVTSDNPTWVIDGIDLAPLVGASGISSSGLSAAADPVNGYLPRSKVLGFDSTGGQHVCFVTLNRSIGSIFVEPVLHPLRSLRTASPGARCTGVRALLGPPPLLPLFSVRLGLTDAN